MPIDDNPQQAGDQQGKLVMPTDRRSVLDEADTIVVKVGTRVLTTPQGTLDESRINTLAEQLARVRQAGRHVVLISSGAVGAGMSQLQLAQRPTDLAQLQAVAAVGQTRLIQTYEHTFRRFQLHAAQVLLTADDLDERTRYLNVRNTLLALLEHGAIPIINENDTVAVDELMATFGENDRLAALVTNLLRAPLLVILSDVEGLYDGPPADSTSQLLETVPVVDEETVALALDSKTGLSKGGMSSKLEAARITTRAGESVIIAGGHQPDVLDQILQGVPIGTFFPAQPRPISSRKRWLAFSTVPCGQLVVDRGAHQAIQEQGRSLLAIGIQQVLGQFSKGDVVSICHAPGEEFARGLTNYASDELERIQGLQSNRIAQVLGHRPYEEVIHRDNLSVRL